MQQISVMQHLEMKGKRVLVRVDFNVPMEADGHITDDTRIRAALPTLRYILQAGGAVVLLSHLGRPLKKLLPDGSIDKPKFSLKPVAEKLAELIGSEVEFCAECIGEMALSRSATLQAGKILLMENVRFHPEEEKGDIGFARELARHGEIFIHDAFGTAHRAHASTAVIVQYFNPKNRAFGLLMEAELNSAARTMTAPERPLIAIVGGAKVSDKILLIDNLLDKVDGIIIGGGMAFTFALATGGSVGDSLVEIDRIDLAKSLMEKARSKNIPFYLPEDVQAADRFAADADIITIDTNQIPEGRMGLDIGPKAIVAFREAILQAKTIIWNGPMGVFEIPAFANGTRAIASAVAEATDQGAYSLIGGGDSVTAINQAGLQDRVSFISTGGGAMLELLEGKILPGVAAFSV